MGQVTPNMGIYIPAAGETNYDAPFAAGMINIDQHDHSGAPNKGVPISSSGLAPGVVTYDKLNANVADNTTGIGTATGPLANQLIILGLLKNIYQLATTAGFISKDGSNAHARTMTGTANQVAVANGDGVSGNPTFSLPSTIYTNISFDSGANTLNSYTTGTFLPVLSFGGASVGITYTEQQGKYWKIGNVVFFNIEIELSNKGSSTGAAVIDGLPFTTANDGYNNIPSVEARLGTYPAGSSYITAEINANATTITLAAAGTGSTLTTIPDTGFTNTSLIAISGFYWTA